MILKAGLCASWLRAEFTLRLQETQRSLRITERHPRNQRWKSGPISAATLQDEYVKHRRWQHARLRERGRLPGPCFKTCRGSLSQEPEPRTSSQTSCKVETSLFSLHIITAPNPPTPAKKTHLKLSFCAGFQRRVRVLCEISDASLTHGFCEVTHWLSSVHRWLTGRYFLLPLELKCQAAVALWFPNFPTLHISKH